MNKVTKNIIWNLVGSLVYYFSQWLMTVLVVRLSGEYAEAGILALSISVSLIFSTIANYSVRNFQVSDIESKFDNGTYVLLRILTCALSLILIIGYLLVSGYPTYTGLSIFCFMLIRITEAVVDVFQGFLQKQWRMDIVGKSLVVRGIVGLLVFSLAEYLFGNVAITCLLTALSTATVAVFMELIPCLRMNEIKIKFDSKNLFSLLLCCTPLFLNTLMVSLIPNFPRIVGEKLLGDELIGYFASVTTPAVVVQMASSYAFSPLIPMMARQFIDRNSKIYSVILKVQGLIIAVGVVAVVGFSFLGEWMLELVFGEEILPYSYLLIPAVIVSVAIASVNFVYALFTVVERNKTLVAVQSVTVIIILTLSRYSLEKWELQGINYVMIFASLVFVTIGYVFVFLTIKSHNKKKPD